MAYDSNPPDPTIPIYTVGYGQRAMDDFILLLQHYQIAYLIDVRTAPYSRYKPEFSKRALDSALGEHGIRYIFLGDLLGGRPSDPACYRNGKIDYMAIKEKTFYQKGLARIKTAFTQQQRVVLMCSEGKPESCHRARLIGVSLTEADIPVIHIDEEGEPQDQEAVVYRLTKGQLSLFDE